MLQARWRGRGVAALKIYDIGDEILKFELFAASFFVRVVFPTPEGEDRTNIIPLFFEDIVKANWFDVY